MPSNQRESSLEFKPTWLDYLKRTINRFLDDDCMMNAAGLAYYTTFSLPPLLLIIISVVGLVVGRQAVQHQIETQIGGLIGQGSGHEIGIMAQNAGQHSTSGIIGLILGVLILIFGATGAVTSLVTALNRVWHVKPAPNVSGITYFLKKRLVSLAMIVGLGFLLLVSLAISAALSAAGSWLVHFLPRGFSGPVLRVIAIVISWLVITIVFGAVFQVLPDAKIRWRDVWLGAATTSALFAAGKDAIAYYLGHSGVASAYGAAGSLVVIVLWVYYSSLLVLAGAELTSVWAEARGRRIQPRHGAVAVSYEERPRAA